MKNKKAILAILSFAFVAMFSLSACTTSTDNDLIMDQDQSTEAVVSGNDSVNGNSTSSIVDKTWSDSASNGTANVDNYFNVNEGKGHLKLLLKNQDNKNSVTVSLTHVESGRVYFSTTLAAEDILDWRNGEKGYSQGMRSGNYIVHWSGGANFVEGQVFGKLASDPTDPYSE